MTAILCLCLHISSLQNTIMITNEEKNNFFSSSRKFFTDITNFTSLIINPLNGHQYITLIISSTKLWFNLTKELYEKIFLLIFFGSIILFRFC